ncbi:hypothetical protein M0804_006420 [Polistes exclamans]|nr:hypothetical protein M0804_006420 [Polistes exclamans]
MRELKFGLEKIKNRQPKEYELSGQYSKREKKRGRAKGRIITGIRKNLEDDSGRRSSEEENENREQHVDRTDSIQQKRNEGNWRKTEQNNIGEEGRKSKDGTKNAESEQLLRLKEEKCWHIANGNVEGNEAGECTYVGAGMQ